MYLHHSIISDLNDTKSICKNVIARVINNSLYDSYITNFIKWIHLILDNIIHHYSNKHNYYFPMVNFSICKQLKKEYLPIKKKIENIYEEHKKIKKLYKRFYKKNKRCKDNMITYIYNIIANIEQLLYLIKSNFNKELNILLPKIMKKFPYKDIQSLDIKFGLRSKWYVLPHLYRNKTKENYTNHLINILQLPKYIRYTTVPIHFTPLKF